MLQINIGSRQAARLAALLTMIFTLYVLGLDLGGDHFWALGSIVAITLLMEFLAHGAGMEAGIEMIVNMKEADRDRLIQQLREEETES
jgi:1,4-dihydroxy-2-naphthoate octaprenyltransferase